MIQAIKMINSAPVSHGEDKMIDNLFTDWLFRLVCQ